MKWGIAATALGLCLGNSQLAYADEPLEALLEENVVSGPSRTSERARDAPSTVSVLTDDDIRRYGIRSLDEAIDFLSMGLVTQNPLHSVEISGRGVGLTADYGVHVLVVVDGHVFNEAWASVAYYEQGFGVPIELIDHIEVMLGPGSVLYGSNAMLAVINVTTKKYTTTKVVTEGSLYPGKDGTGGSYRVGIGTGHEFTFLNRKFDFTAHVERYAMNGEPLRFGRQSTLAADGSPKNWGTRAAGPGLWGGVVRDEYDMEVNAAHAKLHTGDFTFMARAETYSRATPYINYVNKPIGNFDDDRTGERDRWLSFDGRWDKQLTPKLALNLHGNVDIYDYTQNLYTSDPAECMAPAGGPCRVKVRGLARWAGLDGQLSYDWFGDDALNTMVGAMATTRFVGSQTDARSTNPDQFISTLAKSSTYEVPIAVYAQQRWTPTKILHLNAGARLDDAPRAPSQVSPRGAASLDVWRGGVLKGIYSEAFRAPTYYEASFGLGAPVANLRPEKERSVEATFEQHHGRHTIMFGGFRTWWTDMVVFGLLPDGRAQLQNVSSIDNYGYNARAEGAVGKFRYGLSVTGAHSRRDTPVGQVPLPVAPQVFGNARVSYELPGSLPTVALASTIMGPRLADRALDGGFANTPGVPASVRLRATLTGAFPGVKGLTYRASAEYVTAKSSPYVAGPIQLVDASDPSYPRSAMLAPVIRATLFTGLQYEF